VAFEFNAPPSKVEHLRVFACPVRFRQPSNEFTLSRATWDAPGRASSSELLRTLEAHADRLIAGLRTERALAADVARLVAEELQGGTLTLASIARRMAMSPRTLQRRLELEHTTFADVLDQTRRHFADAYLREPNLALTEIAYLLGFSEPSAFTRAFQRWYGVPPSTYRGVTLRGSNVRESRRF
jgi:AraC-like DNA-binding protein